MAGGKAVVGATKRVNEVAADIVDHWEKRRSVLAGKALVVCMSRRICVELYNAIVRLRPDWHSDEDDKGKIKVVITGSAADGPEFAPHVRNKQARRELKERAKNPDDPLELVIVRDMWLTGFDSPPMHTMYVDKPSIIDDNFVRRFSTNPHPNVQIELLKRLLNDELKTVARRNLIAERRFSELLERAMRSYTNRSLDAAEIILQLVELAKELRAERNRGAKLGLRDDELAFYDAVCQNDSAVIELGDDTLKAIAHELVAVVRRNATIDWDKKEQVRASLRRHIRRLLTKYKYPPDRQESGLLLVMQQAELFAAETPAA